MPFQMNSGEDWNNSYLLTVQLDDVLTTRYPKLFSMFSVEITAADSHIKDVSQIASVFFSFVYLSLKQNFLFRFNRLLVPLVI